MKNVLKLRRNGFTLVEVIVAVGLFAVVMLLASGAYLVMISINRQTQAIASGINNLSFALETMTRTIRTGTTYTCVDPAVCDPTGGSTFAVTDSSNERVEYSLSDGLIMARQGDSGPKFALTDPTVKVTSLTFFAKGTSSSDKVQARVTIVISGTVSAGPNKPPEPFTVETGATMRGNDL